MESKHAGTNRYRSADISTIALGCIEASRCRYFCSACVRLRSPSQYRARQKTEQDRREGDHQPADKTRAHNNGMHGYRSTSAL